jgi:NitT/TauT family transport system ATP-binding protein
MSAVHVAGVSKIFNQGTPKQVDALVDVNLTVEPGEFVSLIGPSGCCLLYTSDAADDYS